MHNFRELKIWQRSMQFAVEVYKTTETFPENERYDMVRQIRKCAVSIPSNISEGAGRGSNSQFKYFLEVSMGSCNEIITQLELSMMLGYLDKETGNPLCNEASQIYKMILGFYNSMS